MTRLAALLLSVPFVLGCERGPKQSPATVPPPATPQPAPPPPSPPAGLTLPPSPTFPTAFPTDRYEDGAWSIAGLRRNIDQQLKRGLEGTEVDVRVRVLEIYNPPTCAIGDACAPGKQPHLWVVDGEEFKGKHDALLVANYRFTIPEWDAKRWSNQPDVVLEVGKVYTISGRFKQFSDTGFAHERGLLEFIAVQRPVAGGGHEWIYPPGAPWHPLELARQDKANEELRRKAKRR
ncbi:MAG: hypothetical protein AAF721_10300 [Myxococcota bacterium]